MQAYKKCLANMACVSLVLFGGMGHAATNLSKAAANDPIESAMNRTTCNVKSDCLILYWRIKLLPPAAQSQLAVEIPIVIDDPGGLVDIVPGMARYYAKKRAKKFAWQFIENLCEIENGDPQGVMTDVLDTKEDFERGEVYSPEPFAHMSDAYSDSFTITLRVSVTCPAAQNQ